MTLVLRQNQEPCIDACTDLKKNITIKINPEFDKERPGKIQIVADNVTKHEIDHVGYKGLKGCPRTVEMHVEHFAEPMATVICPKGYTMDDVSYITNCLQDTILHDDLSAIDSLEGITEFFADVGRHNPYSDFYEAHVRLNMYLWGNRHEKTLLREPLMSKSMKKKLIQEVLQNFIKRTGIGKIKKKMMINGKEEEVKDSYGIRNFLNNEENWKSVSIIYAEEFSKLMQPGYAMPILNHSGEDTKGNKGGKPEKKGKKSNDEGEGEEENDDEGKKENKAPKEGNQFDKEMHGKDFKQKRIKKAYENGEGTPEWMDSFEGLDLLYQAFAKRLNIKVQSFTQHSTMPVMHYGKRPFDPDKDDLKRIGFGFDDKGKLRLEKKKWHEDMPLECKVHPVGFPEARLCLLDTSESMRWDVHNGHNVGSKSIILWGDKSKYHYALLAWYGLLEYLKANSLLKQTSVGLVNFSDTTTYAKGLDAAKRMALRPQWGNTYLDVAKVKKAFGGAKSLIFTVSDGGIANWGDIREDFIKYAKQHHYFHLQLGRKVDMTEDLRREGLYVEYIRNASDLATKVIDLTDKVYRR